MSWLGWGSTVNPQYEELVEKACSPLNLPYPQSEDIATSLEITDMIRSKAVLPKPAMQSLKTRVASANGRVQMYALNLVDTCIKNGGDHFLVEIAGKEFVDEVANIIRLPSPHADVKQTALKLFQQWAIAFRERNDLRYLSDVYDDLKNSGTMFPPPTQTSSALISTITAPQWQDSDVCMRCRTAFTFTNRKHHCRNCGLVFDQACSSKSLPLPHFGITTPVRVCDSCFAKGGKMVSSKPGPPPALPSGRTLRSKEDFDADLQRAIELSLADSRGSSSRIMGSEPPLRSSGGTVEDDDEELRLAIEASLREMEKARPSAPGGYEEPEYKPLPTFDLNPREAETILTFSNTLDQMAAYGERDLRRFPHAHVLYEQAYAIGGKLHRNIEEKTTKQQMLAEMQDKLSQAVTLYGGILDGQQAYSAQQMQARQREAAQRAAYSQHQPQPAYSPYANRYAAPQPNGYAYPQQTYQPPHANPSSLYPSMPLPNQPQMYPQQPYSQAHTSTPNLHHAGPSYAPPSQYGQQQYYPTSPSATHPGLERHSSLRSVSMQQPPQAPLQRQTSLNYSSPQIQQPSQMQSQQYSSEPPQMIPSGPTPAITVPNAPPVDMTSHPVASPSSTKSSLPQVTRSASYTSQSNFIPEQPSQQQNHYVAQPQQPQQSSQPYQSSAPPQHQQQQQHQRQASQHLPQQPHQHQQSQQNHQQPQNVYYDSSFPAAPAAVFPDAPASEPQGLEKKEKEEALLIEL